MPQRAQATGTNRVVALVEQPNAQIETWHKLLRHVLQTLLQIGSVFIHSGALSLFSLAKRRKPGAARVARKNCFVLDTEVSLYLFDINPGADFPADAVKKPQRQPSQAVI